MRNGESPSGVGRESQRKSILDKLFPYDESRRKAIKTGAEVAAGAVVAAVAGKPIVEAAIAYGEKKQSETTKKIITGSEVVSMPVPEGGGIDSFLDDSCWTAEHNNYDIEQAIIELNKNRKDIDIHHLMKGDDVLVPVRKLKKVDCKY